MEAFLSQNLVWIILALGAIFVFSRIQSGHGRIFGGGHDGHGLGGLFGGGHGGGDHAERNPGDSSQARESAPPTTDPVSRKPVDPSGAVSSVYGGRVYYFESAETRTKFEAAPSSYASSQPEQQPNQRRHGCC